jgi:hypothetical protein
MRGPAPGSRRAGTAPPPATAPRPQLQFPFGKGWVPKIVV